MDPRVREHAEIVADHAIDLSKGDNLVVRTPPVAEEFGIALHEIAGDRGANPVYLNNSDRPERAHLRARSEGFETPEHLLSLYQNADATVITRGGSNLAEKTDVDPETVANATRAAQPVQQARLATRWCVTQHPTAAHAQLAGMSTEVYENFVYDAVTLDWEAQREFQAEMAEILDDADEVRIRSGSETDVRMSVTGNTALNDYGENNLPGGEVFTAPVPDSVEGTVRFDKPVYRQGREVSGIKLRFEGGRVEAYTAERNEGVLDGVFNTDEGARYLGELGIGMNRAIDRFTYNMLFDEKMGDTVHMAVGAAYEETVGKESDRNESAVHVDMIVDMTEDAVIEIDGQVVQRNGTFVFEGNKHQDGR